MIARFRKSFMIIYASLWLCSSVVGAESFPPQTEGIVQDEEQVMDPSQVKQLGEIIKKLPEKYKVVIIPSTEELTTQQYTDELFVEYGLARDHVLFVFNLDKAELGVKIGAGLQAKGLTDEIVQQTVDHFFSPHSKQKSYMSGISTTAQGLSDVIQKGPSAATAAQGQGSVDPVPPGNSEGSGGWLYGAIGLIIAMIASGVYVQMQRKKWTQEMDDLEDWLDKIEENLKRLEEDPQAQENRNDPDHPNPVLRLIEQARNESLPQAEFTLLEADAMCEKFRFRKTEQFAQETKSILSRVDHEISQMQSKLFQAKVAEEECERLLAETEQACVALERKMDEISAKYGVSFREMRDLLAQAKNWLETNQAQTDLDTPAFLDQLREQKQMIIEHLREVEQFPNLRQEVAVTLERDLAQLQEDLQEMVGHGYQIPVEFYQDHTAQMRKEVLALQRSIKSGRIQGVLGQVNELKDQIDSFYDLMEEIVTKKAKIVHYLQELPDMLASLETEERQLTAELEELSLRYRVQEGAIFNYYLELQVACQQVGDQLFLVKQMDTTNDLDFIQAIDYLEAAQETIEKLMLLREEAYEELEQLRKGEFEAKDIVAQLHTDLFRVEQQIRRKNLPGIPTQFIERIHLGQQSLFEVEAVLNEAPLDLQKINALVKDAQADVEKIIADTQHMFSLSESVEEKIQATNRYRSRSQEVNDLLNEAEEAFRNAEYERADELATEAYEVAMRRGGGRSKFKR
ncbi:hypothetical protein BEP19_00180 [Ammoniphilus oxalaticus]|uniref:TPM domain-containing protein n=1 Tax=Ammoniphilus oxalaticus TaxID=66863 RepID=A0A419SR84_9BACL|nr:septation ring formation regulator EzrA [Ammoniphilus oxalaticus]RKD27030.1 hypothetical protein BEP19_00180 [Ammoniphilus oxalaticus]